MALFNEQPDGSLLADPVEVVPQLAESWKVDGPVITFKLRPGVKFFATGNPVTSEDVRYSFERLVRIAGNGKNQAGIAGIFKPEQIVAVDPQTVQITFTDGNGVPTAIPVALTSMKFQQFAVIDSVEVKKHATADPGRFLADQEPRDHGAVLHRQTARSAAASSGRCPITGRQAAALRGRRAARHRQRQDLVALIKGGVVDYAAEG